jgi:hypothetical protein
MTGRPSMGSIRAMALLGIAIVVVLAPHAALAADPMVSGKYLGNKKPAQLAFARVVPHDPWQGEKAYTLILSEKDASKSQKPDFDAMFGELGHALVINVTDKGSIIGTQVCHQALQKSGFSSSGTLEVEGFSIAGGKLSGHFLTQGEKEFSGETWEIDLKVAGVPLPK